MRTLHELQFLIALKSAYKSAFQWWKNDLQTECKKSYPYNSNTMQFFCKQIKVTCVCIAERGDLIPADCSISAISLQFLQWESATLLSMDLFTLGLELLPLKTFFLLFSSKLWDWKHAKFRAMNIQKMLSFFIRLHSPLFY